VTLAFGVNLLTAALGLLALLSYVFLYTPLKRVSPLAVYVGARPGAAPPLMGYASMTGELTAAGLSLFALLFIWQIPHFHAIAIFRARDYEKAGLEVLPVRRGIEYTKFSIALLLIVQLVVSALPAFAGLGGPLYLTVATALGVMYLGWGLAGLRAEAGARWARSLFFVSMPYLLALFAALVIDAQ
jgi:protoheme IX farnesyltransferase